MNCGKTMTFMQTDERTIFVLYCIYSSVFCIVRIVLSGREWCRQDCLCDMKRKQGVNLDIVLYIKPTSFQMLCSQFHALSIFRKILDGFCALLTLVRNLFRPCSFFVRTFSHLAFSPRICSICYCFFRCRKQRPIKASTFFCVPNHAVKKE